jgi:hypothetical protein
MLQFLHDINTPHYDKMIAFHDTEMIEENVAVIYFKVSSWLYHYQNLLVLVMFSDHRVTQQTVLYCRDKVPQCTMFVPSLMNTVREVCGEVKAELSLCLTN